MRRIGVRVTGKIEAELKYLEDKYKVSASYILVLAYKICDRKVIEQLLELKQNMET